MSKKQKGTVSTRMFVTLVAVMLVLGCAVGGTLAWLTAQTAPVVNTFTVGDIDIDLTETTGSEYKLMPGEKVAKDPKVTVKAGSEKCYVFVKVEASAAMKAAMENNVIEWYVDAMPRYTDGKWTKLTGVTEDIYYLVADASTADQDFYILGGEEGYRNGRLIIPGNVTAEDIAKVEAIGDTTLTFTAYAIQYEGITSAADAWAKLKSAEAAGGDE